MGSYKDRLIEQTMLENDDTEICMLFCDCGNRITYYYQHFVGGINDKMEAAIKCNKCGKEHVVIAENSIDVTLDSYAEVIETKYID